jgi:uncharacterized protein YndB with AHSA1/START domain
MPVVHSTFTIERQYPKQPAQVFEALADPAMRRRWLAEGGGHEVVEFISDFRPGGVETLRYRLGAHTPFPGAEIASEERICDVVPDKRTLITSTMTFGGRVISVLLVTTELAAADGGTLLVCTIQGSFLEGADGPQLREMGWRKLLDRLGEVLATS